MALQSSESPAKAHTRFELELEFVQLFAAPRYCQFIASEGYLGDAAFVAYLRYLRSYWAQPAYSRFLLWPQCLTAIDDLLEDAGVRIALADARFVAMAEMDAEASWRRGER